MSIYRDLFHVPGPGPYLLSHSVGCQPRRTDAYLDEKFLSVWREQGSDGWPSWLNVVDDFCASLAKLLGGDAGEYCPQNNVSAALTALLSGMPRQDGRNILLASAQAFPSIGFAMQAFEPYGFEVELIDAALSPDDADIWLSRIDERVAAVVPMLVHSNSSRISPVATIAERARDVGALTIVDICQASGIVPIDLPELGVDAAVGSCVKWLCGGPGAGFLWLRQPLIADFAPCNTGWFSHSDPFEFDIHNFRYANDARRFWGGTPSIAPFATATAGIETICGIGVSNILAHNRAWIDAVAIGADIPIDMRGRGGTMAITSDDVDAMAAALSGVDCRFDRRGDAIRLSPHAYTKLEEAQAVGIALRGSGARLI